MATHSSILAWRIPWTEEPGGSPWGLKGSDTTKATALKQAQAFKYKKSDNAFLNLALLYISRPF